MKEHELKTRLNDSIYMKSTNRQKESMVIEIRKQVVGVWVCVGRWGSGELTGKGHLDTFYGDGNVLYLE